jgi:hypothetical protein
MATPDYGSFGLDTQTYTISEGYAMPVSRGE